MMRLQAQENNSQHSDFTVDNHTGIRYHKDTENTLTACAGSTMEFGTPEQLAGMLPNAVSDEPAINCGTFTSPKSTYYIPPGCICMGDGLMGMECTATEHARPRVFGTDGRELPPEAVARREQRWKDPDWTCPRCQGRNYGIRETCRFCGLDSALVSDGKLLEPVDDPASVGRVLAEVRVRREEQDDSHGGPAHDDTHTPSDWRAFIAMYNQLADSYALEPDIREDKLFDVAGLAVAAIQSSRRKRNAT